MTPRIERVVIAIGLYLLSAGCGNPQRVNTRCEWRADTPFALDLSEPAHRTHLRHDADLLEDLAIRYADAFAGRIAGPPWAAARDACLAKLFPLVARHHRITESDVRNWIGRRNRLFDGTVFLSFALWCAAVSSLLLRRLFDAWSFRGALAIVPAAAVTVIFTAVGGGAGLLWAALWEVIRLGNEHVSHRASRLPWPYYMLTVFLVAFAVCAFFALREYRSSRRRDERSPVGAQNVLFR
jgi:hypothetical protein